MTKEITLIGAPSSVAAHAPGQEKTPALLREAGLLEDMKAAGLTVKDTGNLARFSLSCRPEKPLSAQCARSGRKC